MMSDNRIQDTMNINPAKADRSEALRIIREARHAGNNDEALQLLEAELVDLAKHVALLKEMANIRFAIKDYRGTVEALDRVKAFEPLGPHTAQLYVQANTQLTRQKANEARRAGDSSEAIRLLAPLLAKFPQDIDLLKAQAQARFDNREYQEVIALLDRVKTLEPLGQHTAQLYARAGMQLTRRKANEARKAGNTELAARMLGSLIAEFPQDADLLKDLAQARFVAEDYAATVVALEQVKARGELGSQSQALHVLASRRLQRQADTAKGWLTAVAEPVMPAGVRPDADIAYYHDPKAPARLPLDEMVAKLADHDVISFDIFDTALVRAVAKPTDVFRLMGGLLGVTDFVKKRKDAEAHARRWSDRTRGTREVTLRDIYAVMEERFAAPPAWEQFEKDLEIRLTRRNPYIFEIYERLRTMGRTLIFTSDMYLPKETLKAMLAQAGYTGYEHIYLSNEHDARKGDGTLQKIVLAAYPPQIRIAHVGDVYDADVVRSCEAGISGVYNPNQHGLIREKDMSSLAGSFYEAVIDNHLGTGMWTADLHYTHGFRTGGILALGYIEFLERLAREKGVDRILFLGRDCDILSQIYTRFFATLPSAYVGTSRAAALMLTANQNFDDFIGRTFFRWYRESNNSRPISHICHETGFGFLVKYLEHADIEPLQFPASANEARLRDFFWNHKDVILAYYADARAAAHDYFAAALGDARKVLLVDIGWTGTCIAALRDFFQETFGAQAPEVFGALLATSRNEQVTDSVSEGAVSAFIYSPVMNQDITRLMMPGGRVPQRRKDLLTLPVEYMFTETEATTTGYGRDDTGQPVLLRGSNLPPNPEQIREIQRGMLDFVEQYLDYSAGMGHLRMINGYVAFQPLRNALGHRRYLWAVYKDFIYDAAPVLHGTALLFEVFGELFDPEYRNQVPATLADDTVPAPVPRILFISPEMKYVGAPRSLLRLCRIAVELGYEPIIWTAQTGPFTKEFERYGFVVQVITADTINADQINHLIRDNVRLVVCNTVVTHAYVSAFEGKLPVVWYVREATNVPQFLRGNAERAAVLRASSSITVVSDYAAQAVGEYAEGPIEVVRNAVEDVSDLALPYTPKKDGVVRFVQLGTIEHRKGYDLFVAAFRAMPASYRAQAELHFAGGFINSGTGFASYLFGQIGDDPAIHYHGNIADERQKIELLSQMDAVVVASRDESCSLVALEGAMLSKPLIVSENVGAKYMVVSENGLIVPSGDVVALRDAFMQIIDRSPDVLLAMGQVSRQRYDEHANLETHRRELGALFAGRIAAGPRGPVPVVRPASSAMAARPAGSLIVSLTSFPPRMSTIGGCITSLKQQSHRPAGILLWLSEDQFPGREADLPDELLELVDHLFSIRWVSGDLGPHKKYFYAMQEFPDAIIVTVDDDVHYDKALLETLYQAHLEQPDTVVAGRCNLMRFRPDGILRTYDHWGYDHQHLRQTETYSLLQTGIGGVLYPPGAVPAMTFDAAIIKKTSLFADDLWLKVMVTANGYPIWMPHRPFDYSTISGSQGAALWRDNTVSDGNDIAIRSILEFMEQEYGLAEPLLRRIQGVRTDGSWIGPGDPVDRRPLL